MLVSAGKDKTVRTWNVEKGAPLKQLAGHQGSAYAVALGPDGKTAASGSQDKSIRLWDLAAGSQVKELQGSDDAVLTLVFSPDGKVLYSAGMDKTIRVWDVTAGKQVKQLTGHHDFIYGLALHPDGNRLVSDQEADLRRLLRRAHHEQGRHHQRSRERRLLPDRDSLMLAARGGPRLARTSGLKRRVRQRHCPNRPGLMKMSRASAVVLFAGVASPSGPSRGGRALRAGRGLPSLAGMTQQMASSFMPCPLPRLRPRPLPQAGEVTLV
jgi:hypothetical protein